MSTLTFLYLFFVIALGFAYGENLTDKKSDNYDTPRESCALDSLDRTIGGEDVEIRHVPFQLELQGLYMEGKELKIKKCGASIISMDAAITAKHCVTKYKIPVSKFWVRAGSSLADKGKAYVLRKIVLYSYFPGSRGDIHDDIALIFTKKPFEFSANVQPIKLPASEPKNGLRAMITGWGSATSWSGDMIMNPTENLKLKKGTIRIMNTKVCFTFYKNEYFGKHHKEMENFYVSKNNYICAGNPSISTAACLGDSGGPLHHNNTLYGVISGELGCALDCRPNLITNVYRYVDWIVKEIKKDDLEGK